jgi:hypothetical protein
MKPRDPHPLSDAESFDLLESPESWPEDPALQAELAALLELHLALHAHGELPESPGTARASEPLRRPSFPWLMSAAAMLLVALPVAYHLQNVHALREAARNQARIQTLAQKRGQDRLWAGFFQQSSSLLQAFREVPQACARDRKNEDRSAEREVAFALLQASHKLAAQDAPGPDAELLRSDLHAWLMELTLEDGCLDPRRAEELRRWADAHNLEDEALRMGRILQGEAS